MKPIGALFRLLPLVLASLACARSDDPAPAPMLAAADALIVAKAAQKLTLLKAAKLLKTYPIALEFEPIEHRQQAGDGRTTKGSYSISGREILP